MPITELAYPVAYLVEENSVLAVFTASTPDANPGYLLAFSPHDGHIEAHIDYLRTLEPCAVNRAISLHNSIEAYYALLPSHVPSRRIVLDQGALFKALQG